ncbi:amino acid ABC transporter permease [Brachybacterium sp. P6-10-X1]|uniref:amino acid ABC transporter permease n=1 Tax=Brachybacterium sp. P6-10-X1 TaxID=1903186 RepID=UPI000971BA4C|nr:amino acid ABC transporter permease [Brachybacterium sp. P6-10-X1]APX32626.1 amino acid ABC transporter permease [Brachybacterium sp. P6-10-X1]
MSTAPGILFDAPGPRAKRNVLVANLIALAGVLVVAALVLLQLDRQGQLAPTQWVNALNGNAWANYYLPGLQFTLQSSGIAVVTAMIFGLVFGFLRLAPFAVIRGAAGVVVEFFRAVPVLVMMFFLYFFISRRIAPTGLIASEDSAYFAVIVGLTVYNGAVIAELIRAGVKSLPKGQREAAAAVGMTRNQSLRIVEVPQALTAMLPSLLSQFVVILKDSALGFLIGFYELLQYSRQLGSGYSNIFQTLVIAAVIFIVINCILTWLATKLAGTLSSRTGGATAPTTSTMMVSAMGQDVK